MIKRKIHNKISNLIKIVLIITLLAGLIKYYYNSAIYEPIEPENTENISFQIKTGTTSKQIAQNLEDKDLIKSPFFFYLYAKIHDLGEDILAGRFVLNKGMNVPEIFETITDPSKAEIILTIQEGLRIKDIEQKLVDLELIQEGELVEEAKNFKGWEYYNFLDPSIQGDMELKIEGYVYPDTYFLNGGDFQPHDIIYLGIDNFEKTWESIENKEESRIFNDYTTQEIIIMASIIENEVFGVENRKLVAGILWKRLESGWALGADATLLYITEDRVITAKDLEIDSPYNTRKNQGLPPGPICNPSRESMEAALFPTKSDYWFYLTTLDTGEVIYSKTNEEHNINKGKYL